MAESASWHDLLRQIVSNAAERERLANEIGVRPITLNRWISGESRPRPNNVRQLVRALPQQYRSQFLSLFKGEQPVASEPALVDVDEEITYEFIMQVFDTYAMIPDALRFWTICRMVIQHALRRLDAERVGMMITVVQCMPPSQNGKVRSLRESVGQGTPPWESELEPKSLFLGAESLAGYAVTTCYPRAVQDLTTDTNLFPSYRMEPEMSALACPLLYANRVAGCVLFASTQPNYFLSQSRVSLARDYTQLIALAFEPDDFYSLESIQLHMMPSPALQQDYFATFRQRVHQIMVEASRTQRLLNSIEAERIAWQQLEDELINVAREALLKNW
jgi:hypothetical protein